MAWTTAQLDSLREAVASGVLTVRDADGKSHTYRSQAELLALIAHLEGVTTTTRRPSVAVVRPRLSRSRGGG